MRRLARRMIVPAVVAILMTGGEAEAFTPVPIPTPRHGGAAAAHIALDYARAITRGAG